MVFWAFCQVPCWVQIWLLSQLYGFPGFLYGLGSRRISPFWYGSLSPECLRVWWLEGYPLFYFYLVKVQTGESEWMMNLFELLVETILSVSFIVQEAFLEGIFSMFYCWILLHIQICSCLWSYLYKCGSSYVIFLECWRVSLDRLRNEYSF